MAMRVNIASLLASAAEAEAEGDTSKAIELYEKTVAAGTLNKVPYNRLMILYRKEKEYAAEMKVLKKAIAAYTTEQAEQQKNVLKQVKHKKGLGALNMRLAKSLGAVDRKGRSTYLPEPLGTWVKRKELLQKKLKAK